MRSPIGRWTDAQHRNRAFEQLATWLNDRGVVDKNGPFGFSTTALPGAMVVDATTGDGYRFVLEAADRLGLVVNRDLFVSADGIPWSGIPDHGDVFPEAFKVAAWEMIHAPAAAPRLRGAHFDYRRGTLTLDADNEEGYHQAVALFERHGLPGRVTLRNQHPFIVEARPTAGSPGGWSDTDTYDGGEDRSRAASSSSDGARRQASGTFQMKGVPLLGNGELKPPIVAIDRRSITVRDPNVAGELTKGVLVPGDGSESYTRRDINAVRAQVKRPRGIIRSNPFRVGHISFDLAGNNRSEERWPKEGACFHQDDIQAFLEAYAHWYEIPGYETFKTSSGGLIYSGNLRPPMIELSLTGMVVYDRHFPWGFDAIAVPLVDIQSIDLPPKGYLGHREVVITSRSSGEIRVPGVPGKVAEDLVKKWEDYRETSMQLPELDEFWDRN